jgi:hypothetical protein
LQADDVALEIRVLLDEDLDVCAELLHFKLEVGSQNRNLSVKFSQ